MVFKKNTLKTNQMQFRGWAGERQLLLFSQVRKERVCAGQSSELKGLGGAAIHPFTCYNFFRLDTFKMLVPSTKTH